MLIQRLSIIGGMLSRLLAYRSQSKRQNVRLHARLHTCFATTYAASVRAALRAKAAGTIVGIISNHLVAPPLFDYCADGAGPHACLRSDADRRVPGSRPQQAE